MKFNDIIITANQNMFRSKARTILTIIAIFVGALTISLTVGLSSGISDYISKQVGSIGAKDALIVRPKVESGFGSNQPKKYEPNKKVSVQSIGSFAVPTLDQKDLIEIRKQKGILNAEPTLGSTPDYITGKSNEKYIVTTTGMLDGMKFDLVAGEILDQNSNQVLLPIKYVSILGFESNEAAVGKQIKFGITGASGQKQTVTATIAGVPQESIIGSSTVFISQSLAKNLFDIQTAGMPEASKQQYHQVVARVAKDINSTDLDVIKKDLANEGYEAVTVDDQIGIIKQVIDAITYVLIFFGAIALLAASFGIINTLFMAVQERTKEIGLMKAMGMNSGRIFTLFSFEAILLGFWGSIFGVLAAMGIGQIVNQLARDSFLKDLPGFNLTVFPIVPMLLIMLLIMFIAFLAGTLPARRAAKQDPIEALRYE